MMKPVEMKEFLKEKWEQLEASGRVESNSEMRKYSRLNLEKEKGVRISCTFPEKKWELMVEIESENDISELVFPNWKGMGFEFVLLPTRKITRHLSISLETGANREVFATVCADLVSMLERFETNAKRSHILGIYFAKWSNFFERHKLEGLSSESQRGLFGELWWLHRLLFVAEKKNKVICAWKGCKGSFRDFEVKGHGLEVKTTMTKEPRHVTINNEKQLDDRGLASLHLLVLTLMQTDGGSHSLPSLVQAIREILSEDPASFSFEDLLFEAGYLDVHAEKYQQKYSVVKEELFQVKDGFPRIISIPEGIGDIRYSLVLSSCSVFVSDSAEYLELMGVTLNE